MLIDISVYGLRCGAYADIGYVDRGGERFGYEQVNPYCEREWIGSGSDRIHGSDSIAVRERGSLHERCRSSGNVDSEDVVPAGPNVLEHESVRSGIRELEFLLASV